MKKGFGKNQSLFEHLLRSFHNLSRVTNSLDKNYIQKSLNIT